MFAGGAGLPSLRLSFKALCSLYFKALLPLFPKTDVRASWHPRAVNLGGALH